MTWLDTRGDEKAGDQRGPRQTSWIRGLVLLFLLALVLRVAGLLWGGVHNDEHFSSGVKVLSGQIIPDDHFYPPLLYYLNAVNHALMFAVGRLVGYWQGTAAFREQYFNDPRPFYLSARMVPALAGALAAIIAALAARQARLSWWSSLLVGLVLALLPTSVWNSHINKSDVGMGFGLLLAVCIGGWSLAAPRSTPRHVAYGLALAVAVSFKQSAIFMLMPLTLFWLHGILTAPGETDRFKLMLRAAIVAGLVSLIAWIPMNVGTILDFKDFLEYQRVLLQMHTREFTWDIFRNTTLPRLVDRVGGTTLPVLILALGLPLIRRDKWLIGVWVSTLVALGWLIVLEANQVKPTFFLPFAMVLAWLAAVAAATLLDGKGLARWMGLVGMAAMLSWCATGSAEVLRQALAPSQEQLLTKALARIAEPEVTRILAANPSKFGLPISLAAKRKERERHERLALKYDVTLPPEAEERARTSSEPAYFINRFPWTMGGLEVYEAEDVEIVKPFAWPLQDEEWNLDHWLDQGFKIFVVEDEAFFLSPGVPAYQRLHQQIRDRCELVEVLKAKRPLFQEKEMRIYRYNP